MPEKTGLLNDCFLHDRDRMRHDEVIALLTDRVSRVTATETVTLAQALGRHIAGTVTAPRDVPLHDNSAVDGYAFAHSDYGSDPTMTIGPRLAAGVTQAVTLADHEAARIFTGAAMPRNADTVAMQEDCQVTADGRSVRLPEGLRAGANRRMAGEDLRAGEILFEAGILLRPQDIAALASLGKARVRVFEKLRIALISSGDELVRPADGAEITAGQVFDSNHQMLDALCRTLPAAVSDLGIVEDDAGLVGNTLGEAAANHDLIITTGGASRGDEDHLVQALDRLGKRHLWQIAIKPGRPMTFGQIGSCVFLGLPGNPVAAFVCFLLYAIPVIRLLSGGRYRPPQRFRMSADFSIAKKKTDRREFLRGWIAQDSEGNSVARKFSRDGSGLISGLRQATGLIELPEEIDHVSVGDTVDFIPFPEFGIPG